jgi:hypothetical protein
VGSVGVQEGRDHSDAAGRALHRWLENFHLTYPVSGAAYCLRLTPVSRDCRGYLEGGISMDVSLLVALSSGCLTMITEQLEAYRRDLNESGNAQALTEIQDPHRDGHDR